MKIKLESVTGEQLDWLVAQCEGHKVYMRHQFLRERHEYLKERGLLSSGADLAFHLAHQDDDPIIGNVETGATKYLPRYTLDWALAGPIIERERIWTCPHVKPEDGWFCELTARYEGPTPLTAAMRCFVSSKLDEEVEVPDELA